MQLVDQINCSFEKRTLYTLGIFVDISKDFDTEETLTIKLENYGV